MPPSAEALQIWAPALTYLTYLTYTGLLEFLEELEYLKIETRIIDEKFASVMGECVILR